MSATQIASEPGRENFTETLKTVAPFNNLPDAVLEAISDIAERRDYLAGEVVFALGQFDGGEFFLVKSGQVRAARADADSGAMLVEDFTTGQLFGLAEAVASDENPRAEGLTLTVEEDVELIAIDAAAFRAIISQRPSLTRGLMQYFAAALVRASTPQPAESSAERRVFAALMGYVERDAISGDWRVPKMPKHRELAEKAGADEAAAASAVAQLIQQGVARREYPGLVISDMAGLTRLAS
jgi:CRP-like cAMP-binding protein